MCTGAPKTSQGKQLDFQICMNATRVGTFLTLYPYLPLCKHCLFFLGLSLGTQRTSPGPWDRHFEDKSYVPLSLHLSLWNIFTPGPLEGYPRMLPCPGCLFPLGTNLLLRGEQPSLSPSLHVDGNWASTSSRPINEGIAESQPEAATENCSSLPTPHLLCIYSWIPPRPLIIKARLGKSNIN